ncbi:MAG: phosphohistidine phosphatase [Alphaproteobacteria bacterium]|nr:phosphohistidine phosphatase [Alphaproteobacteria bacterium]
MLDCRAVEIDAVAMRLLLLRHAKAEKATPGVGDRERELAPRGFKDAARIGAYMAHHGLIPGRALVSPARRTRETWESLAPVMRPEPELDDDDRLYDASAATIFEAIKETGRAAQALLVIGHNPGLQEAARRLIASGDLDARERLNEGLPTSGLVVIDFAGDDWGTLHPRGGRLERFVTPRSLKAATD